MNLPLCFRFLLLLFIAYSQAVIAQTSLEGTVKDAKKKSPLPFCGIALKGTTNAVIANEEGRFRLDVMPGKDSLVFSFLGYQSKTIAASSLLRNPTVYLENKEILFEEVVIHAGDEYLYDIMLKCRNKTKDSPEANSKAYFSLETMYEYRAAEMLEAYYNASFDGSCIRELGLKNGRIGLARTKDSSYFVSMNTSRAVSYLNLTQKSDYLPQLPLQLGRQKMKKIFSLKLLGFYSQGIPVYHIGFSPKDEVGEAFHGEIWIDKETFSILKISLKGENARVHPFQSLFPEGSIDSVNLHILQNYDIRGNESVLNNISFDYSLVFDVRKHKRHVETHGLLHFYDYGIPFELPWFQYDVTQSDYRKITFFPYNAAFWDHSRSLVRTDRQQDIRIFMENNGLLLNYRDINTAGIPPIEYLAAHRRFFEDNYVFWSDTNRLSLKSNLPGNDSLAAQNIDKLKLRSELYELKAQIYMDVNPAGDSLHWLSATVFDVYHSYYKLPEDSITDCFINIFFDICEIQRRNMEKELRAGKNDLSRIDSIYRQSQASMNEQTALYLKKVQCGKKRDELKKWNDYVFKNLGVDNFKIYRLKR